MDFSHLSDGQLGKLYHSLKVTGWWQTEQLVTEIEREIHKRNKEKGQDASGIRLAQPSNHKE